MRAKKSVEPFSVGILSRRFPIRLSLHIYLNSLEKATTSQTFGRFSAFNYRFHFESYRMVLTLESMGEILTCDKAGDKQFFFTFRATWCLQILFPLQKKKKFPLSWD